MIKAEIVAHSLSPQGDELISVLCTFPRIILAEVNTHRMLSKNTSSSRAIPFKKMVESVKDNPFIPIAWQKQHSGMQGTEYHIDDIASRFAPNTWLRARDKAVEMAEWLHDGCQTTKQLANRLLEPFMWTTMLITGSRQGWDNFFHLRCPVYITPNGGKDDEGNDWRYYSKKDVYEGHSNEHNIALLDSFTQEDWLNINQGQAEIHIMDLAEKIWDAVNESTPKQLKAGEWHIPFNESFDDEKLKDVFHPSNNSITDNIIRNSKDFGRTTQRIDEVKVKISTAMAARTSYTLVGDEKEINYEKMVGLHDKLLSQDPPHSSPLEHCARAMSHEEYKAFIRGEGQKREAGHYKAICGSPIFSEDAHGWCNNFKGFIQYRYLIDNGIAI